MGYSKVYTDVMNQASLITIDNPVPVTALKSSQNLPQTPSNKNRSFQTINIWNDQIDNEILSKRKEELSGTIIKCPALFVEFITGDGYQIGGGVTQFMEAAIYFHIFSDQLNTPNKIPASKTRNTGSITLNPNAPNIFSNNTGDFMDMNLEIYDLRDSILSTFSGFHTHHGSAFMLRYDKPDYKHFTITKHLVGFSFCWNDDKGSIFDKKSSRYLVAGSFPDNIVVTPKVNWISGNSYTAVVNTVWYNSNLGAIEGYYNCANTNTDAVFTPANWRLIKAWNTLGNYSIGNYVYVEYFIYMCIVANNDVDFNPSNWELTSRI